MHGRYRRHNYVQSEVKRELKTLIGVPERKWFNITRSVQQADQLGIITNLSTIPQGVGDSERIGDTVSLHSFFIRYKITCHPTAPLPCLLRILIFRWTQDDLPVPSNILEDVAGIQTNCLQPINKNYGKSIHVLYDKLHTLSPTGSNAIVSRKKFKHAGYQIEFNTAATVPALTPTSNGTYLMFLTDANPVNTPFVSWVNRLTYTDV